MNILLWIIQVLLSLLFMFTGVMKFLMPVADMQKGSPVVCLGGFTSSAAVRNSWGDRVDSACPAPHQAGSDAARRRGTRDHYGRRDRNHPDGTDERIGAGTVCYLPAFDLRRLWPLETPAH